jgi:signal transduction histidine kinase
MGKLTSHWRIRTLMGASIGFIALAAILLAVTLVFARARLRANVALARFDDESLNADHVFEIAVFAASRNDSLWRLYGDQAHEDAYQRSLREADRALGTLARQADSPYEAGLARSIRQAYLPLRADFLNQARADPVREAQDFDKLLQAIHLHRNHNDAQRRITTANTNALFRSLGTWSLGVLLAALLFLALGSAAIWLRVFRPIIAISQAARQFGGGDLKVRAPVVNHDEMGALADIFNDMATAIEERESDRLDFVATVAHDLKNPLTVVGGAAMLLMRKDLDPESRDQWLESILRQSQLMEAMIGDLTQAVQVQTGRLVLQPEPGDLYELARRVVRENQGLAQTQILRCDPGEPCPLVADFKRLERVLVNLISNGLKYSRPGSQVTVSVQCRPDYAVLSVRDQGVGIAPEDIPRLFAPFARLHRTRDMAGGTGLGLSSAKKIVEAHGGTMELTSVLGEGSTVTMKLPREAKS